MTRFTRTLAGALSGAALLLALGACDRQDSEQDRAASERTGSTSDLRAEPENPGPAAQVQLAPLDARISFSDGGPELSESATAELASILRSQQIAKGGPIELRAHSDSVGSDEATLRISRQRGEAVRNYLVANGVDPERITIIAFGEQNPLQPNALPDGTPNEPGRAANRRVDLLVALPTSGEAVPEGLTASDDEPAPDPG